MGERFGFERLTVVIWVRTLQMAHEETIAFAVHSTTGSTTPLVNVWAPKLVIVCQMAPLSFAFPTQERWGLIWAFNGREPTYNVPTWEEDESERCYSTIMVADYRGDPFLAMLNVIDVQHLRSLHGLDVSDIDLKTEDESFQRRHDHRWRGYGTPDDDSSCPDSWEEIPVVYSRTSIGIDMMSAATPYGDGRSRLYLVTAGLHSVIPAESIVQKVADRQRMSEDVIAQDIPVLERIRFRVDKVTSSDRGIVTFLQLVTNYPLLPSLCSSYRLTTHSAA